MSWCMCFASLVIVGERSVPALWGRARLRRQERPTVSSGAVNDVASFCSFFDTSNAPSTFDNLTDVIQYYL